MRRTRPPRLACKGNRNTRSSPAQFNTHLSKYLKKKFCWHTTGNSYFHPKMLNLAQSLPGLSWRWVDPRCCSSSRCLSLTLPPSSWRQSPAAIASQWSSPVQRSTHNHTHTHIKWFPKLTRDFLNDLTLHNHNTLEYKIIEAKQTFPLWKRCYSEWRLP